MGVAVEIERVDKMSLESRLRKHPRRSIAAAATTFVVTLGFGAALLFLGPSSDSVRAPTSTGSNVAGEASVTPSTILTPVVLPSPLDHSGFIPIKNHSGDLALVDATFTDGRRVLVTYPDSWKLSERGWWPSTGLTLELDEPLGDGTRYLSAQLILGFAGATGAEENGGNQKIFTFGDWAVSVITGPETPDVKVDALSELLSVSRVSNGFAVVETGPPLKHFTGDTAQSSTYALGQRASIRVGDVMKLLSGCDPAVDVPQSDAESVSWCDPDARVAVGFFAPQSMHDAIRSSIDITLVEP